MITVGRIIGKPENYISYNFVKKLSELISDDINPEIVYEIYFYTGLIVVLSVTALIYILIMQFFKEIRRN